MPIASGAQVPSATPPATTAAARASEAGVVKLPLSRLLGGDEPLRAAGTQAELQLTLPVPAHVAVQQATLELGLTVSEALIAGSQLVVQLNGQVVFQQRLNGAQTPGLLSIPLPTRALKPGFNDIKLAFAQHYTDRCEYPWAAQLWSQVDVAASRFVLRASAAPITPRLDRLAQLFDKATWETQPVVPVLSRAQPPAEVLRALGLVAQGLGQRFDYVPARIVHGAIGSPAGAAADLAGSDRRGVVVVGTFQELAPWLQGTDVPQDGPPMVAVRTLPGAPDRFAVIIAAKTDDELRTAATAFALPGFPWPDRAALAIPRLELPPPGSISTMAQAIKPATQAYPLGTLGFHTQTLAGLNARPARTSFWSPAWQGRAQLRVHASYAAGMRGNSTLNVLANGALVGSIPLGNPAGGTYDNYAVTMPAGALHPGWNTLEFQPVLVPSDGGGECKPFFPGSLSVTVYDDTTLQTFGGSALSQPDLSLLSKEGRVQPEAPVGQGMAIALTDNGSATLGAGLTFLLKQSQVFKGPMLRTALAVGPTADARNQFWVGPLDQLPAAVRQAVGFEADGRLAFDLPVIQSAGILVLEGGPAVQALQDRLASAPDILSVRAHTAQPASEQGYAATAATGSGPVTVLTGATAAGVEQAVAALVDYGPWSQLRGRLSIWTPGEKAVRSVSPEAAPFTAYSLRGGLGLWISQYPWWSLALLLTAMALLVWALRLSLAMYRRKNLPSQSNLPKS